jgi:hypothetical protein
MRIRQLIMMAGATAVLAVPGLASTAGATPVSGHSRAVAADGEKNVSPRAACGRETCGFNGTVEYGTNYVKIWGLVWGTSTNEGIVQIRWSVGGATFTKEAGSAPNRTSVGVNKYYTVREASYILVRVCGVQDDECGSWEDP